MIILQEKYWDDFAVGETFRTGSITVTEAHMVQFSGLTGDYHPLHSDAEYCKNTIFQERIIHGPLTFGLALGLAVQSHYYGNALITLAGVDHIRFKKPVKPGDTLTVELAVESKKEISNRERGITTILYQVINQRQELVAEFQANVLMKRRS